MRFVSERGNLIFLVLHIVGLMQIELLARRGMLEAKSQGRNNQCHQASTR